MKTAIKQNLGNEEVEFLKIRIGDPKYSKLEKNEFFYGENLYDVISMEIKGGYMHIRCINDVKEQQLFKNLDDLISKNLDTDGSRGNVLKKIFSSISLYIIKSIFDRHIDIFSLIVHNTLYIMKKYFIYANIPNPPPEFIQNIQLT